MDSILDLIKQNSIYYQYYISGSKFNINWDGDCRFGVIIPARGRESFLPIVIDSFRQTCYKDYFITVVEHSDTPVHEHTCAKPDVNYIHIPAQGKPFNKCLCFNMGVIASCPAKYYIFHDLDCLIQSDFFEGVNDTILQNDVELVQTFKDRRLLYCDQELTDRLLSGITNVNDIDIRSTGVLFDPRNIGAPGGSILASKDLFFAVGGYDPELFWSYAPEDEFFLHKAMIYVTLHSCNHNEIFHLNHPSSVNSNPELKRMVDIMKQFKELPFTGKEDIVDYKRKLLEQYDLC